MILISVNEAPRWFISVGKDFPQWFTSVWKKLFYNSLQRKRSSPVLNLVWMKLHSDSYECKWSSSIIDVCGKNAPVIQLYVWKKETCCYLFGRKYQLMYVANASPWFARLIFMMLSKSVSRIRGYWWRIGQLVLPLFGCDDDGDDDLLNHFHHQV